jgi:hypothetical protein
MSSERLSTRTRDAVAANLRDASTPAPTSTSIDKGEANPMFGAALRLCGLKKDSVSLIAFGHTIARI